MCESTKRDTDLVEGELDGAGAVLLRVVDGALHQLHLRREPEAVVAEPVGVSSKESGV